MTDTLTARKLYGAVRMYTGSAIFDDVLAPWIAEHGDEARELLAPLDTFGRWRRVEYVFGDLLEQAYAYSRVSDILLLGFQPDLPTDTDTPWAHELHLPDRFVTITHDEYVSVFSALGMHRVDVAKFDPFFHEIVAVVQSEDSEAPVEIVDELWPCVMLGEMMFGRAGVAVRAGERHVVAGIADRSGMDEVFLRRYRPTDDQSLGWGHNSQWKTDFRRDYLTSDTYLYNVDADTDIDEDAKLGDPRLTPSERRDVLRHRCKVRPLANVPEYEESWAGCWRLSLPRN